MIQIDQIQKTYNKRVVLDIKNYQFEQFMNYGIIGENGAGKTTLLRVLSGIIKPDIAKWRNNKLLDIGYLPQKPYIFNMTVRKNIEIAMCYGTHSKKARLDILQKEYINHLLKILKLESVADTNGNHLSGGEAQRLALARLIACPHDLLILDEPTSSMDMVTIKNVNHIIKRYAERYRCTVIFSTHDMDLARSMADKLIIMDQGQIINTITPALTN